MVRRRTNLERVLAFAPHLDRSDTDDRADAPRQPVDDFAVADIDRSLDPVFARFRPGVDGHQPEAGDPRLVEKATKGGVYVARM